MRHLTGESLFTGRGAERALARIERRVIQETPAERAPARDLHDGVELDLDRTLGALQVGELLALPEKTRPARQLKGRARVEVHEEQPHSRVRGDVAQRLEHVVAGI